MQPLATLEHWMDRVRDRERRARRRAEREAAARAQAAVTPLAEDTPPQ